MSSAATVSEIDSNICENALRCVALDRRNYLFFGSERRQRAAAIIWPAGTCKLNDVSPRHGYATFSGKSATGHRTGCTNCLRNLEP
ncbi:transposase [Salmonella enterica subsp. enterica]|nr:transposase [Salmonella enterica subsp. enterica]